MERINIELLKKLRKVTFASFKLCKKALLISKNNLDKAVNWLRVKGIAQSAKQGVYQTSEGVCQVFLKDNKAVLLELNCQTDFAAQNEQFFNFFLQISSLILASNISTVEQLLHLKFQNATVQDEILRITGILGEKIEVGRLLVVHKKDEEVFAHYNHTNKKVCSLLVLDADLVSKEDLAMQVVAMQPQFISTKDVTADFLAKERKLIVEQLEREHGKETLRFKDQIVNGRMKKMLGEVCLLEQKFIKNPKIKISDYLNSVKVKILQMFFLQVGVK